MLFTQSDLPRGSQHPSSSSSSDSESAAVKTRRLTTSMSPKKKKAKKMSAPVVPEQPSEYASHIRFQMRRRMKSSGEGKTPNYDIEQNIREIRAILAVNTEIFVRCMDQSLRHSTHNSSSERYLYFQRFSFDVVKVCARKPNSTSQFTTKCERVVKKFNLRPLMKLPACLTETFAIKHKDRPHSKLLTMMVSFRTPLRCMNMCFSHSLQI